MEVLDRKSAGETHELCTKPELIDELVQFNAELVESTISTQLLNRRGGMSEPEQSTNIAQSQVFSYVEFTMSPPLPKPP